MNLSHLYDIRPHYFPCFVSALPLRSLGHCPPRTVSPRAPQPQVSVLVPVPESHQMSIQADEMEHVVLGDCVCAAEQTGKLFDMKVEVQMMHGVLGKVRHECKMLLGKHYGKWSLVKDKEG